MRGFNHRRFAMRSVNPATGLPMMGGFDIGGNAYAGRHEPIWMLDDDDDSDSKYHSCRLPEREYGFLKFISVSSIIIALIAIFS